MCEKILEKLAQIEEKYNVKIIYAAESGSRAWGFPSPDSDYDVRFIYVHSAEYYLRVYEHRDVIECGIDGNFDINGWDLRKALSLLTKSNPTLFEWANSPIVYKTTPLWESLKTIMNKYFKTKLSLYHYLHMARRNAREYLMLERVKLKKYLYVLRPMLAVKFILDNQSSPPMLFSSLIELYLTGEIREEVERILHIKMESPEIKDCDQIVSLTNYVNTEMETLYKIVSEYPVDDKCDIKELDKFFYDAVMNYNNL